MGWQGWRMHWFQYQMFLYINMMWIVKWREMNTRLTDLLILPLLLCACDPHSIKTMCAFFSLKWLMMASRLACQWTYSFIKVLSYLWTFPNLYQHGYQHHGHGLSMKYWVEAHLVLPSFQGIYTCLSISIHVLLDRCALPMVRCLKVRIVAWDSLINVD